MEFLKNKKDIVQERLNSIHESVFKMGDLYKVRTNINIPKSLINAFISKAKKENGLDPRENWSDTELAEMFVSYITTNFFNIESLPVNAILGDIAGSTENTETTNVDIDAENNGEEGTEDFNAEETATEEVPTEDNDEIPATTDVNNIPTGTIEQ